MTAIVPWPERRSEPRIRVDLPARLLADDGERHAAIVRDISVSGLQLQVAAAYVKHLLPNLPRALPNAPVETVIAFDVPLDGRMQPVLARCGIAYLRRLSHDDCLLGVSFREFDADSAAALGRFWQALAAGRHHTPIV